MTPRFKTFVCFACAILLFMASVLAQTNLPAPLPPRPDENADLFSAMYITILHNKASLLVIIVLSVLAWLIDSVPFIDSRFVIHLTSILGASGYWLFAFPSDVPKSFPHPVAVLACIGFVCGFVAGVAHRQIVSRLIEWVRGKIPAPPQPEKNTL